MSERHLDFQLKFKECVFQKWLRFNSVILNELHAFIFHIFDRDCIMIFSFFSGIILEDISFYSTFNVNIERLNYFIALKEVSKPGKSHGSVFSIQCA